MNIYATDVVIDPTDSNTVYYTTAAQAASHLEADPNKIFVTKGIVYKTSDGGENWEELPTGFILDTGATGVYINSKNPQDIFVTTYNAPRPESGQGRDTTDSEQMGFLKSFDGGINWQSIHSLPVGFEAVIESAVSPREFSHIFVSPFSPRDQQPKSFYSVDGGLTFKTSNIFLNIIEYDPYDSSGNHLLGYQHTTMGSNLPAIYESNDAGANWKKLSDAPQEIINNRQFLEQASNIVWDPKNKNVVYLTGAGGYVWKSIDKGKTWETILSLEELSE